MDVFQEYYDITCKVAEEKKRIRSKSDERLKRLQESWTKTVDNAQHPEKFRELIFYDDVPVTMTTEAFEEETKEVFDLIKKIGRFKQAQRLKETLKLNETHNVLYREEEEKEEGRNTSDYLVNDVASEKPGCNDIVPEQKQDITSNNSSLHTIVRSQSVSTQRSASPSPTISFLSDGAHARSAPDPYLDEGQAFSTRSKILHSPVFNISARKQSPNPPPPAHSPATVPKIVNSPQVKATPKATSNASLILPVRSPNRRSTRLPIMIGSPMRGALTPSQKWVARTPTKSPHAIHHSMMGFSGSVTPLRLRRSARKSYN